MPVFPRSRWRRALVLALLAALLCAGYMAWYANTPVTVAAYPAEFEIPQGAGLRVAARVLVGPDSLTVEAGGERLSAPVVVSAVPWFALADVFPQPPQDVADVVARASSMASSPIVTINLWFDRPVLSSIGEPFALACARLTMSSFGVAGSTNTRAESMPSNKSASAAREANGVGSQTCRGTSSVSGVAGLPS